MRLLPREESRVQVEQALRRSPVVLLTGPRQCGKTTLARQIVARQGGVYFDLEDPENPVHPENAQQLLAPLKGLVVLDELQHQPTLLPTLRVLADRRPVRGRFLILGSASPQLIKGASESLAGRVAFIELSGFNLGETGPERLPRLWLQGGLPPAFLTPDPNRSFAWRRDFIQSFLERDIPKLGIRLPAAALRRFWTMLAHFHGQVWNAADLARAMGTKEDTARHYLDILTGAFMIRQLPPWYVNIGKRLVKAPKIYFLDSGLLHALLGIRTRTDLFSHPKLGFSWEGFALEQVLRILNAGQTAFFYSTHAGAELDLLVTHRGKPYGFEFKLDDAPRMTKSMHVSLHDLQLKHLWVVYPGHKRYPLKQGVEVIPLAQVDRRLLP